MNASENALLVTGLPGVPGWNLFHWFRKYWPGPVVGIRPTANLKAHAEGAVALDAEDFAGLQDLFKQHRFTHVVDASGNCALKACEYDPKLSRLLNCDFGVRVAELSAERGARLVRLSSDLVFSGRDDHQGPYLEHEITDPVTVYGADMALSEERILKIMPSAVILRIPLPMGYTPGGHAGAIDWIEWRFRNGRPATLYFDECRNPIHKDDLAQTVQWLLQDGFAVNGLFHCGGPRKVSLYETGQIINAVGAYDPKLLMGCPRYEAGPMPPRAGDVGMDSSKLLALLPQNWIHPWPFDARLVPTDRTWHHTVNRVQWGNIHQVETLLLQAKTIEEL